MWMDRKKSEFQKSSPLNSGFWCWWIHPMVIPTNQKKTFLKKSHKIQGKGFSRQAPPNWRSCEPRPTNCDPLLGPFSTKNTHPGCSMCSSLRTSQQSRSNIWNRWLRWPSNYPPWNKQQFCRAPKETIPSNQTSIESHPKNPTIIFSYLGLWTTISTSKCLSSKLAHFLKRVMVDLQV